MATIEPANATNKGVTWASDNTAIATVDDNGKVTAVALGTAKITVTTEDGGKEAICWVKVVASDSEIPVLENCVLYLDGSIGKYMASDIWYDLSGNGNHGTLNNFAHAEGSGWTDEGLQFNGVEGTKDDYVDCGNYESLDITDNLTLEAWVKIGDYFLDSSTVMCKTYAYRLNVRPQNRYAHFDLWVNNGEEGGSLKWNYIDSHYVLPESGWIHLVGTYADNTVKIYVNGELTVVKDNTDGIINESTEPLIIGREIIPNRVGYPFVGVIGDIRVYNKALTAAEVLQNYLAGRSSP